METEFETRLASLVGIDQGPPNANATPTPLARTLSQSGAINISGQSSITVGKVRAILRSLISNQASALFRKPVDPEKLRIPHYPDIIKRPMDLQTVSKRLEAGSYATVRSGAITRVPVRGS